MSQWIQILTGAVGDGLILCLKVSCIVVPLLFGYELAKAYGVFRRPWPILGPALARLGLGTKSLAPLLAGLFLGILYAGGLMVAIIREDHPPRRERLALAVFLSIAHAVVEDTAIFAMLGGSAVGVLLPRLVLAAGLCYWLARRPTPPLAAEIKDL